MKKVFIIILSFIVFSLQAQSRKEMTDEALKSWTSANEHDLIMQLGSPTSTTSDGAKGKIIRYSTTTSTMIGTPIGASVIGTNYEEVQFYDFYINSDGIVYAYKTNYKFTKRQAGKIHKEENIISKTQDENELQQQNTPTEKSKTDRLRELKQMFDEKLITQDEYTKEKKKILDEK